jgi:hypothetical protein
MVIRSGGEHGWSFFRTDRVSDISSTKRRCPVCICSQQIERDTTKPGVRWPWNGPAVAEREAEGDGRPKKASTDTRLSDVGISYDQSSPRQKLAAVPEEIFEHAVQDNTHMPTTAGLIQRQCMQKSSTAVHLVTAGFFRPRPSIARVIRRAGGIQSM